jgi:hypothetical protein
MSNHEPSGCHGADNTAEQLRKPLRHAERDLEKALEQEQEARREVEKAETEVTEAIRELESPREFNVEILYDGVKKKFEVRVEETVKALLDKALAAFGPLPNPHTLSLYRGGDELLDSRTLKDAGVKPQDVLLLRPSKVKGGA